MSVKSVFAGIVPHKMLGFFTKILNNDILCRSGKEKDFYVNENKKA